MVDLPEVLLEVANWTGFIEEFTHVSEAGSRVEDLATSICTVLIAEACLRTSVGSDRKAWVAQNYLREDTLARANARLVAYHAELPLGPALGRRRGGLGWRLALRRARAEHPHRSEP